MAFTPFVSMLTFSKMSVLSVGGRPLLSLCHIYTLTHAFPFYWQHNGKETMANKRKHLQPHAAARRSAKYWYMSRRCVNINTSRKLFPHISDGGSSGLPCGWLMSLMKQELIRQMRHIGFGRWGQPVRAADGAAAEDQTVTSWGVWQRTDFH